MTVTIVAAIASNGVIGVDGGLPWRIPGDLPRLKAMTTGHVVIMGRKTYDSIGRPLPGRTTIVVTRQADWAGPSATSRIDEVRVAGSLTNALDLAAGVDDEIFVLGGAEIYALALPHADRLEITEVDQEPAGDTWFPDVDWSRWRETARDDHDGFAFVTYDRHSP